MKAWFDIEIWKPIKDYEGLYEVSNFGRIRSLDRMVYCRSNKLRLQKGKYLQPCILKNGYLHVLLCKDGSSKSHYIHRLVAEAFIYNYSKKTQIDHIDGNKLVNTVSNLKYCTPKENSNNPNRIIKLQQVKKEKPSRYWLGKSRSTATRSKISISLQGNKNALKNKS